MFIPTTTGCRCTVCGRKVRGRDGQKLIAECHAPCQHLGEQVGQVKVFCDNCGEEKEIDKPAHRCEVYRRCLPTYRPSQKGLEDWQARKPESDLYHLCHGCESFEAVD